MTTWITNLSAKLGRTTGDKGQTLVEYALIIGVFSTLMVASLGLYQGGLSSYFSNLVTTLVGYF
jgi:Flp pilus assembly pilin Flp